MPLYDYQCKLCNFTFEQYTKMSERKEPESKACPHCGNVECVEQTIVFTALPISHVSEGTTALKKLNNSHFAEKLNQIHQNTPGSQLDKLSNIVTVK